jgi:transcription initiation factor TFIIIB Brf1 subunit/transcription initiation factor TFIIB
MSGARGKTSSTDVCGHQNTVDTCEGDNVCTDCGKVVGQVYETPPFFMGGCHEFVSPDVDMYEFIRDCGENAKLPPCVMKYAENHYSKIKVVLLKKCSKQSIAAYALYESLNMFEVPRLAEEIAYYTGVSITDIWRVESNLVVETTFDDPAKHIVSYCQQLNMSYSEQMTLKECVESIQEEGLIGTLRSNCLSAVLIYTYCKYAKKKITLKKICETCDISATSVHRVIRQLTEHSDKIKQWMMF